jgi:hypothetical protein
MSQTMNGESVDPIPMLFGVNVPETTTREARSVFWLPLPFRSGWSLAYQFFFFDQIPLQRPSNCLSLRIGSKSGSIGNAISQNACSSAAVRKLSIAFSWFPMPA